LAPEFHSMLVTQLQREASRGLAPKPVPICAALFRSAEESETMEDDYGWGTVCERLTVIPVGGDHLSMLSTPYFEILRDKLLKIIEERVPNHGGPRS
jgi:thioesterase domain-containing protein